MKKNRMMRAASALLVAVLLTTCTISGTFAKYVTSASATDSARVAKWGVDIVVEGDLFYDAYADVGTGNTETTWTANEAEATITVQADTDNTDVVAPGTKCADGLTFTISGTPEVDTQLTFLLTATKDIVLPAGTYEDPTTVVHDNGTTEDPADVVVASPGYYPVVFTLTQDGAEIATGNLAAIKDVLEAENAYMHANQTLNTVYNLTWEWAFDSTPADPADVSAEDIYDTLLGNGVAGAVTDIDLQIDITIEQVD